MIPFQTTGVAHFMRGAAILRAGKMTATHSIQVKRIYRAFRNSDGKRVLVDRLWPRGMSKARARLDEWLKEIAPSHELRKWYHANPECWTRFQEEYRAELDDRSELVAEVLEWVRSGPVTLLYGSSDTEHNHAILLREYLLEKLSD